MKKKCKFNITVTPQIHKIKKDKYIYYCVQGWKENGKYMRKRFKTQEDADLFASEKRIELQNESATRKLKQTHLSDGQIESAERAFNRIGSTYHLDDVVDFFLANNRPPDYTIALSEAKGLYLKECEHSGIRERTIKQKNSVLSQFNLFVSDREIHSITTDHIKSFLQSLRAKNGVNPATRKTWNNYRNDINHFFKWATQSDLSTNRPFCFSNPVEEIRVFSAKQIAEQRKPIAITTPHKLQRRMTALMHWKEGSIVKYFALTYFAGIRPDGELSKLAKRENELINLKTRTISIPASISKTKEDRKIHITDNLLQWLIHYQDYPILPKNSSRLIKRAREAFKLQHDEARHSYISYHVAKNRSVGDVALQAGNSESIIKKHYLNLQPKEEGDLFFSLSPCVNRDVCTANIANTCPE